MFKFELGQYAQVCMNGALGAIGRLVSRCENINGSVQYLVMCINEKGMQESDWIYEQDLILTLKDL